MPFSLVTGFTKSEGMASQNETVNPLPMKSKHIYFDDDGNEMIESSQVFISKGCCFWTVRLTTTRSERRHIFFSS